MDKERLLIKHGLENPFKIKHPKHKYAVFVKNPLTGRIKTVKFGAVGYEDFLTHKDPKRRANFKKRHKCEKKTDKLKPGFWSCNWSW